MPVAELEGWEGDDILGTLARRGEAAGENPEFLSIELVRETVTEPIAKHFGANPPGVLLDLLADPRRGAYRPAERKAFYERLEVFLARWRGETEAPLYVNVRTPLLQTPALMKLLLKSGAYPTLTLTSGGASLSAQLRSLAWYDEAAGEAALRTPRHRLCVPGAGFSFSPTKRPKGMRRGR